MSDKKIAVIGSFDSARGAGEALFALRQGGFRDTNTYALFNSHEMQSGIESVESPIELLALAGAAAGASIGLFLTIYTSSYWSLVTGGQPVISLPPFFIISFELTILFGVLATIAGLFWAIRRGRINPKFYHPRFSVDRFGVQVVCDDHQVDAVKDLFFSSGAEEVRDEEL